ncbi:MAG: ADP-glyceromanno-heptose 6-epimerase [bacterium]
MSPPPADAGDSLVVTGAAGFIGARLAVRLIVEGERVVAADAKGHFSARPEIASLYRAAPPAEVVDREDLPAWLDARPPSAVAGVLHMGACTDTTEFDEAYLERTNTAYTRRLWEWAAAREVPFLYASSAAVYGGGEKGYDDEEPPGGLAPLNPYGWSKHRFDVWALGEGGRRPPPRWSGFRFFNVYGFGEAHKGKMASVLHQAFRQIQEGGEVRLFRSHREGIADGHQKRDFVFVDDVVDVLLHAWRVGVPSGIYNLGTGRARTFLDLARASFSALGREPKVAYIDTPPGIRERYQYFTQAKMDKLRRAGYTSAFLSVEEGARRYWERLAGELVSPG